MVRKASDMVLLLGSRGRYRGRSGSGFLHTVRGLLSGLLGGGGRRGETRASRASAVPGWLAFAGALLCFAGGFFVGGQVAAGKSLDPDRGAAGLQAGGGARPGVIGEVDTKVLASRAFIVSAYPGLESAEAKGKARALSDFLRGQKLLKARPYEYATQKGPVWVVAVYFDGDAEQAATRERLLQLPPEVPDEMFLQLRKTEADWPKAMDIR